MFNRAKLDLQLLEKQHCRLAFSLSVYKSNITCMQLIKTITNDLLNQNRAKTQYVQVQNYLYSILILFNSKKVFQDLYN
ncbi:hypothetical protein DYY65_11760 [Nitrososphaera sp. AFS]|nr:hypothetical protein [Nitrososphaera sp. AFS]